MLNPLSIHLSLFAYEWTLLNAVYKILAIKLKVTTVFSASVLMSLNITQLKSKLPQQNNTTLDTKLTAVKEEMKPISRAFCRAGRSYQSATSETRDSDRAESI